MIDNIKALSKAILEKKTDFEVTAEAFDFCNKIRKTQISASGNDWSIAATSGWLAIVTVFNHSIHRAFMKQENRDKEDLQHDINKFYIIRKTEQAGIYKMILRK